MKQRTLALVAVALVAATPLWAQVPRLPPGAASEWIVRQPEEIVGYLTLDPASIRDRLPGSLRFITVEELAGGGVGWAREYLSAHPSHGGRAISILEIVRAGTFSIDGRQPLWPPNGAVALWFARVAPIDEAAYAEPGQPLLLLDLWMPDSAYAAYMSRLGYHATPGDVRLVRTLGGEWSGRIAARGLNVLAKCSPAGAVLGGSASRGTQVFYPPADSPGSAVIIVAFAGHRTQDCTGAATWRLRGDHPAAGGTLVSPSSFEWGYELEGGTYRH